MAGICWRKRRCPGLFWKMPGAPQRSKAKTNKKEINVRRYCVPGVADRDLLLKAPLPRLILENARGAAAKRSEKNKKLIKKDGQLLGAVGRLIC